MTGGGPSGADQSTLPESELMPAWRAACLAYRAVRRQGKLDQPAWLAARAAVLNERPELTEREAGEVALRAICHAATWHTKWFWSGVGGEWPPPDSGYSWGT